MSGSRENINSIKKSDALQKSYSGFFDRHLGCRVWKPDLHIACPLDTIANEQPVGEIQPAALILQVFVSLPAVFAPRQFAGVMDPEPVSVFPYPFGETGRPGGR